MYLSYSEYEDMGGTLDEVTFNDYEWEAETIIDWYTFKRLKKENAFPKGYPTEVKRCVNKLIQLAKCKADILAQAVGGTSAQSESSTEAVGSPMVASQSNDGVSTSYNIISASEAFSALTANSKGNLLEDNVKRYLNGVVDALGRKLLYRGVYEDE